MKKHFSMQETGRELGISTRSVSAWVQDGRLVPLPGTGGQGRAALFDRDAVLALRDNYSGAEFLARARYAFEQDRAGRTRQASSTCPPWISWNMGPSVGEYLRIKPGLPSEIELGPLAFVPNTIKKWASLAVKLLSKKEVHYLTALFIASEYPPLLPGVSDGAPQGSFRVLSKAIGTRLRLLWRYRPAIPRNEKYLNTIATRYEMPNKPNNIFAGSPAEQRDRLAQWVSDVIFCSILNKDFKTLRRIVQEFAPKNRDVLKNIIRYVKLENAQAKLKNVLPSPAAVAAVLGLSRMQGFRQWREIKRKLSGQCRREFDNIFSVKKVAPVVESRDVWCLKCNHVARFAAGVVECLDKNCGWRISIIDLEQDILEKRQMDNIAKPVSGKLLSDHQREREEKTPMRSRLFRR